MKKVFYAIAALLLVVGCSKEQDLTPETPSLTIPEVITAGFEDMESRTYVDADLNQFWTAGDLISVFTGTTYNLQYRYTGETGLAEGEFELYGTAGTTSATITKNYAVYPYAGTTTLATTGVLTYSFPTTQAYAEDSFGLGANTMVAVTASADDSEFAFKNVGGYIRVLLYGDNVTVKSIKLESNDNTVLSGKANITADYGAVPSCSMISTNNYVTLDCGEGVKIGATEAEATPFWFVVPACEMAAGFTITVTDVNGSVMTKSTEKAYTVNRNEVKSMTAFKFEGKVIDKNLLLDVQFNADGSATDLGCYGMTIKEMEASTMAVIEDSDYPHGNVVKFTREPANVKYNYGAYWVDYSANGEFQDKLTDGFTFEVVAKQGVYSPDPWMRIVSSNTFGLSVRGHDNAGNGCSLQIQNSTDNVNNNRFNGLTQINIAPELNIYHHYIVVYDNPNKLITVYMDGVKVYQKSGTVAPGTRLCIGGFPYEDGWLTMTYNGSIAMTRIYDNTMTATEVKQCYDVLNMAAKPTTLSKPIFDAQFNADGTATNVGTDTSVVIESKLNANLTTVEKAGQYVAKFTADANNESQATGFYRADISSNTAFANKLKDGFTMEVICKAAEYPKDFWSRVFGTSSVSIYHTSFTKNDLTPVDCKWASSYACTNTNWSTGNWKVSPSIVSTTEYTHIVLSYDGYLLKQFVNGELVMSYFMLTQTNPGNTATDSAIYAAMGQFPGTCIGIGSHPQASGNAFHLWKGEIATARIYDESANAAKVQAMYEAEKTTIQTLSSAQ